MCCSVLSPMFTAVLRSQPCLRARVCYVFILHRVCCCVQRRVSVITHVQTCTVDPALPRSQRPAQSRRNPVVCPVNCWVGWRCTPTDVCGCSWMRPLKGIHWIHRVNVCQTTINWYVFILHRVCCSNGSTWCGMYSFCTASDVYTNVTTEGHSQNSPCERVPDHNQLVTVINLY